MRNEKWEMIHGVRRSATLTSGCWKRIGILCLIAKNCLTHFAQRVALLGFACVLLGALGMAPARAGEIVLHSFIPNPHGAGPYASVCSGPAGKLYGTTAFGGRAGAGVVYYVDAAGRETVVHSFTGSADGVAPFAGVTCDSAGNLYGTTYGGGSAGAGVVFKLDATGHEAVLHSFTGGADGAGPNAVIRDRAGNLYGTTSGGGSAGAGVVYKVTAGATAQAFR